MRFCSYCNKTAVYKLYITHNKSTDVKQYIHTALILLFALGICGCASRKKNTAQTRMYHAFTARYNTFYNANVAYKEGVKSQIDGHKDNYLETLPLFINSNEHTRTLGGGSYKKAIEKTQKAIKNHTIKKRPKKPVGRKLSEKEKLFYAQKEFNPFLWRAWLLMADSYFNEGEFTEAAGTYIYIARLYENDPKIVARARIGLAKCYTQLDWLYESEELLARVKRDSLPASLEKEYAHAKAGLLLKQQRYLDAIPHIEKSISRSEATKMDKAREYYLLGQLYKKLGDDKSAFKNFEKTISKNPPYELEFNARIRQTESLTNQNKKSILRKLNRMARNPKNKDYLSQVYYATGNIHLNDKDTATAIKTYEKGVKEGAVNGYGTGMLHLSLAKIYWEREIFSKAKANYDKAKIMLGDNTPEKQDIARRCEILQHVTTHTDIVEKQSELLYWSTLPEEKLNAIIDELIKEAKEKQKEEKKAEKKKKSGGSDALAEASKAANMAGENPADKDKWYFYNPQVVAQGITTFAKEWNNRELKDYWRLSNGLTVVESDTTTTADDEVATDSIASTANVGGDSIANNTQNRSARRFGKRGRVKEAAADDPTTREYYTAQIPVTDEAKQQAHEKLSKALFDAGVAFKDKAEEKALTLKYLERVVAEYPEFENLPDTYYHLYLACSRWEEAEKAEYYKELLLTQFPDNELSARIQQPGFFESAATRKHNEDSIYVKAYNHYLNQEYTAVECEDSIAAQRYPTGNHRARFLFISAMSKLYGGKQAAALETLKKLVTDFAADSISGIANEITTGITEGRLLRSGISMSIWDRKSDGTIKGASDSLPAFSTERNEPYCFILAFPKDSLDSKRLLFEIARHNFSRYMVRNFDIQVQELSHITLLQVQEFLNFDEAFLYRKRLYEEGETAKMLEGINAYIISKTNLQLLLDYYSFADYEQFYEENLQNIPLPEIDGYTLDEPDFEDDEEQTNNNE